VKELFPKATSFYFNAKAAKAQRSQRAAEQKERKRFKKSNLSKIENDSYFYCSLLLFATFASLRPLR
jgi:RNA polymerase-binding transcription factor DksA